MVEKLRKLKVDSPDKKPNGWLATLLRRFIRNNIDLERFPKLIMLHNRRNKDNPNGLQITNNTINNMFSDRITFDTFQRSLHIFNPDKLTITVTMELPNGDVYKESITPIDKKKKETGE